MASDTARSPDSHEAIPYFLGGLILGAVAIAVSVVLNGIVIAVANWFVNNDICGVGLPQAAIISIGVIAVLVSVVVGAWMLRLRRWIGTKAEPDDEQWVRLIRRHFTIGAFLVYLPLTPGVWAFVLAAANCAG
jgi:hypothetical protein